MKRALVVLALAVMSGCAVGGTFGRDTTPTKIVDVSALVVSNAMLVADAAHTHSAAAAGWVGFREVGVPAATIMGEKPSTAVVTAYFAAAIGINTAVWLVLPPRWRSILPGVIIGAQADALAFNYGLCRSC